MQAEQIWRSTSAPCWVVSPTMRRWLTRGRRRKHSGDRSPHWSCGCQKRGSHRDLANGSLSEPLESLAGSSRIVRNLRALANLAHWFRRRRRAARGCMLREPVEVARAPADQQGGATARGGDGGQGSAGPGAVVILRTPIGDFSTTYGTTTFG